MDCVFFGGALTTFLANSFPPLLIPKTLLPYLGKSVNAIDNGDTIINIHNSCIG